MIPLYDSKGLREMESGARSSGVPELELMETAGAMVWFECRALLKRMISPAARLLMLVGPGNNGGDALVCARFAAASGHEVTVWLPPKLRGARSPSPQTPAGTMLARLEGRGAKFIEFPADLESSLGSCDLVLDGLFGVRQRLPLEGEYLDAVRACVATAKKRSSRRLSHRAPIFVAIDRPSGHPAPPGGVAFPADYTLAISGYNADIFDPSSRAGLGTLVHLPLCFPLEHEEQQRLGRVLTGTDLVQHLPRHNRFAFKKTRGFVALVAGSPDFPGARDLALGGAIAAGAGGLYIAEIAGEGRSKGPAQAIPFDLALGVPPAATCVVAGSGWPAAPGAAREAFLGEAASASQKVPLVIDGGGLGCLARLVAERKIPLPLREGLILTPHPGEFDVLAAALRAAGYLGDEERSCVAAVAKVADLAGCVIVYRASFTVLAVPGRETLLIDEPNQALGFAGSGDVFAGVLAAVIAKNQPETRDIESRILTALALQTIAAKVALASFGYFSAGQYIESLGRLAAGRVSDREIAAALAGEFDANEW